jgi:membrane protein involved in colicin uptake
MSGRWQVRNSVRFGKLKRVPVTFDAVISDDGRINRTGPRVTHQLGRWPKTDENRSQIEGHTGKKPSSRPVDKAAERKAALAFEKEQKRREHERASEEAAKQKARERRQQAIDKAQAALETAEREHAKRVAAIQANRPSAQ